MNTNRYKKDFGDIGENIAIRHYLGKGYKLLNRNVFFRGAELDIIFEKDATIYFIEVKTVNKDNNKGIKAEDNWTKMKQRNMRKGIEFYLYKYKLADYKIQIDLACVYIINGTELQELKIYENIILD